MFSLTSFITLAVFRFHIFPTFCSERLTSGVLLILFLFPIGTFSYMLFAYYHVASKTHCGDFEALIFAVNESVISISFLLQLIAVDQLIRKKSDITVSANYIKRHTRPLLWLMAVYSLTSLGNLAFRIYIYIIGGDTRPLCLTRVASLPNAVIYFYLLHTIFNLNGPSWGLFYYLYITIKSVKHSDAAFVDYSYVDSITTDDEYRASSIGGDDLIQYSGNELMSGNFIKQVRSPFIDDDDGSRSNRYKSYVTRTSPNSYDTERHNLYSTSNT